MTMLNIVLLAAGITAAFSPGNAQSLVVQTINGAKTSIHVAAYSFTSKPIALALIEAHRRGVDVEIVVDSRANAHKYTAAKITARQGIPTRINDHYAIMHDKFMVVDSDTVETGSFNYTKSAAERNAENVIVIHDADTAHRYDQEWLRLWDEAAPIEQLQK